MGDDLTICQPWQLACYSEWLQVEVALRLARTHPWSPELWAEVRQPVAARGTDAVSEEGVFN